MMRILARWARRAAGWFIECLASSDVGPATVWEEVTQERRPSGLPVTDQDRVDLWLMTSNRRFGLADLDFAKPHPDDNSSP
jgi:hypothetical protein